MFHIAEEELRHGAVGVDPWPRQQSRAWEGHLGERVARDLAGGSPGLLQLPGGQSPSLHWAVSWRAGPYPQGLRMLVICYFWAPGLLQHCG